MRVLKWVSVSLFFGAGCGVSGEISVAERAAETGAGAATGSVTGSQAATGGRTSAGSTDSVTSTGRSASGSDAGSGSGSSAGSGSGSGSAGSVAGTDTSSASATSSGTSIAGSTGGVGTAGNGSTSSGATGGHTGSGAGTATGATVTFSIDLSAGPARQFEAPSGPVAISPYVYGINEYGYVAHGKTQFGIIRQGGDGQSDYNWTTNYTNVGADYCFGEFVQAGGANTPAGAFTSDVVPLATAQASGWGYLATISILDHVASNYPNNTGLNGQCPGTVTSCSASGTAVNTDNLPFAPSAAFTSNFAAKDGGLCTCVSGQPCAQGCTIDPSGPVYQDELVNYLKVNFGSHGEPPLAFDLDNEPNYWGSIHPEIWTATGEVNGTVPCQIATVTYDDVVSRDVTFAKAIKTTWPEALVYGPVVAQDGMLYAHSYSDPHLPTEFSDYYLQQLAAASATFGSPLLDAFDVHYYNNNTTDPNQCLQNPRMFWDPNYTSLTASETDAVDFGWSGLNNDFDTKWYPREMIPRLQGKIAAAYGSAAKVPGLSFSEYNCGCELAIQGGVAEADDLGIFGREGVFSATAWPLQTRTNSYLVAAYDAYRNYDGQGSVVGDTAVAAQTSAVDETSVYAFTHAGDASALDLVALNKTAGPLEVSIQIAHPPALSTATLYQLVDGAPAVVPVGGAAPAIACGEGSCSLTVSLPATSVTTLILR